MDQPLISKNFNNNKINCDNINSKDDNFFMRTLNPNQSDHIVKKKEKSIF